MDDETPSTNGEHGMQLLRTTIVFLGLMTLAWAGSAIAGDDPLEKYKDQAEASIEMNEAGKKFQPFTFDHAAHATEAYLFEGSCSSCHHTQKDGAAAPKPCSTCHDVGGEAGEKKAKAKAFHSKKSTWEGPANDDGGISCLGCHKSVNTAIKNGTKEGAKTPAKCSGCRV